MSKFPRKPAKPRSNQIIEKRLQDQEKFFATISHEIRTPLNAIVAIAEILLKTTLNPDQKDLIKTMKQSGEGLMRLINDFLDYTKYGAKQLKIEKVPFNIRLLLKELVNLFSPQADEKGLNVECKIQESFPDEIYGDPNRIRQILINFLSNALKFTCKGGVKIELKRSTTKTPILSLLVIDTGLGISSENINQLFTEYYQIDESSSRHFGGTGLGLYISKILAELMGGSIRVNSELHKGSTFTLELPLEFKIAKKSPTLLLPQTKKSYRYDEAFAVRFPLKLLVAEDNPVNQKIMRMLLEKLGYKDAVFVENGLLAVQAVNQYSFDLVLMDIQMPIMDGITASEEILKFWEAKPPTVVALTAVADNLNPSIKKVAGICRTLSKPLKIRVLADELAEVFCHRNEKAMLATMT